MSVGMIVSPYVSQFSKNANADWKLEVATPPEDQQRPAARYFTTCSSIRALSLFNDAIVRLQRRQMTRRSSSVAEVLSYLTPAAF
jgi:hypothetical protein